MKRLLRRVLYPVAAAALAATLFGCAKEDGDVTNPNPEVFKPKGMVQGLLRDSVTLDPIVGAVVDIGVATATTNERGQFVLKDVPVNQTESRVARSALYGYDQYDAYQMTIDLRGVKSPVDMKASTTTVKYPAFKYTEVRLQWESMNDTEGDGSVSDNAETLSADDIGAGSGSNHDTPVSNLVANIDATVGKLSTSIKGCVLVDSTRQAVADASAEVAGFEVTLTTDFYGDNSGSGSHRRVLATAPVVGGQFSFSNVEALGDFQVEAVRTDGAWKSDGHVDVETGVDGTTADISCATGTCEPLLVKPVDECDPILLSVSVQNGADLAPAANQAVVFTFSEPIADTVYAQATDASKAVNGGLYSDVSVTFNGEKLDRAGNQIAHTVAWSADRKQLTVTIAQTGVSSLYTVSIANAIAKLQDAAGNAVSDERVLATVNFSTNGGAVAAAPADLVVTDAANIDFNGDDNSGYAYLDWSPASGAKSYNVYCAYEQLWADDNNVHQFELVDNVDGTETQLYLDGGLVENDQIALQGLCYVVGVNSDGLEGAASDTVTIKDVVRPEIDDLDVFDNADYFTPPADGKTATFGIDIDFSEPMDEVLAEDVANYAIVKNADAAATDASLTVLSAEYDTSNYDVHLTVQMDNTAGGLTYSGNWTLTALDTITDVAGNALKTNRFNPYDNGVAVLNNNLQLINAAALGYGVQVNVDDGTTNYFDTVLLWNGDLLGFVLPTTPYASVPVPAASYPRLTWDAVGNSTFEVIRWRKVLNGVDEWEWDNSWNVLHATSFVDADFDSDRFAEEFPYGALQHFPVEYAYQLEEHLADSSVGTPGSFELIARSPLLVFGDEVAPYLQSVTSNLPILIPANDSVAYQYTVTVVFNEPVHLTGLLDKNNYSFKSALDAATGDILPQVIRTEYDANHNSVILTVTLTNPKEATGPEANQLVTDWVLTVSGVNDLAGNTISTNGDQWAAGAFPTGARPAAIPTTDTDRAFNPF